MHVCLGLWIVFSSVVCFAAYLGLFLVHNIVFPQGNRSVERLLSSGPLLSGSEKSVFIYMALVDKVHLRKTKLSCPWSRPPSFISVNGKRLHDLLRENQSFISMFGWSLNFFVSLSMDFLARSLIQ